MLSNRAKCAPGHPCRHALFQMLSYWSAQLNMLYKSNFKASLALILDCEVACQKFQNGPHQNSSDQFRSTRIKTLSCFSKFKKSPINHSIFNQSIEMEISKAIFWWQRYPVWLFLSNTKRKILCFFCQDQALTSLMN